MSDVVKWAELTARERDCCEVCGEPVPPKNTRWCSSACRHEATTLPCKCGHCGHEFRARKSHVERGQYKYCSTDCAQLASRKNAPVDFNGDRFYLNVHGYYESAGGALLHRAIWEYHHGAIPDGHVVHHVDGNEKNNAIVNLRAMRRGKHSALHNSESPRTPRRPKRPCADTDCERPSRARGLCTMHYQRVRAKERGGWQ